MLKPAKNLDDAPQPAAKRCSFALAAAKPMAS
jgi:hypothetical protein